MKVTVNLKTIQAEEGEILSDVLIRNRFFHPYPCAGKGICKKCKLKVDGKEVLSCQYKITHDICVELEEEKIISESGILAEDDGNFSKEAVLDIGTTTMALASLSYDNKSVKKLITFNNPQISFGADVISRIEYAQKNGVTDLSNITSEIISSKISELFENENNLGENVLDLLHVAGNTAMLHILVGENPASIGVSPYKPVFLEEKYVDASSCGIKGVRTLHLLPSISSFVGADLVAGLNLVGLPDKNYNLLLDLGTNAEILLFSKDKILATSAAAGPCFEGANISCGMSATSGAVSSYREGKIVTIDNAPPVGICGTGLVDIIAYLLNRGIIDKSGYMEEDFQVCEGVEITQEDVRQYQLAKSAVSSAILTLMNKVNLDFCDIGHIYVSGGFSAKLDIDSAIKTGLIAKELKEKFVYLGNSSLMGTIKSVFEKSDFSRFISASEYTDLSNERFFCEKFIQNIGF